MEILPYKRSAEVPILKLWQYLGFNRLQKERVKSLLFYPFPFVFKQFSFYHNWKDAQFFGKNSWQLQNPIVGNNTCIEGIYNGKQDLTNMNKGLAIVIHVFYLDVFKEIIAFLVKIKYIDFRLYITCPFYFFDKVNEVLKHTDLFYTINCFENRGRDILPFLNILPKVFDDGFSLILKVHTKKSNHLRRKEQWRTDLFAKLMSIYKINNAIRILESHPQIGMLGPAGHILPMSLYYGGNADNVKKLCLKMGLKQKQLNNYIFVAGSMFYAKKEALLPILKLKLDKYDFEDEGTQLDNTMAHAVERLFVAGLLVSDMKMADTSSSSINLSCNITTNHHFTI